MTGMSRRRLLKQGLWIAGSAAAGITAAKAGTPADHAGHIHEARVRPDAASMSDMVMESLPVVSNAEARQGAAGRKWVMVIDLAKCDGCNKCIDACSKMHFVPPDRQWLKVLRMQDASTTIPYFFPRPCFHCDNPPCTKVCPVDATFKTQDGTVLVDNERCIGCRFCMAACPYGVRCFNWGRPHDPAEALATGYSPEHGFPRQIGTVEKCDFCPDMARLGKLPACVSGCPMQAIYFGDENEDAVTDSRGETLRFSKLLRQKAGYRYLEDLGTQPRVYYLPPVSRLYPAPDEAKPQEG